MSSRSAGDRNERGSWCRSGWEREAPPSLASKRVPYAWHQATGGRSCGRLGLVVTDDERERAWGAVHDALARMTGWAGGPCTYHGEVGVWYVSAIDLRPGSRYSKREAITATGATEIDALAALVALLEARQISGR